MGIPFYVRSLIRSHPAIEQIPQPDSDVLALDFNCFLHRYLEPDDPVGSLVRALDSFLREFRGKRVYIAFDGLVPYAKMVQQRYRRMKIPEATTSFDKHQLSPGTPFMRELADTIRILFPTTIVSDTLERGEGEHKIFQWLRTIPAEERKTICIYGLDADLVLISIAQSHLGHIRVLRERDKEPGFRVISIPALMEVLPLDPETYVKLSVMSFGNDFMPNLAMFSLRQDGYPRALFYATKNSAPKDEHRVLLKRASDSERRIVAPDGHALEQRFAVQLMDGVVDWAPVVQAFWKTYAWTLHYFKTSEVLDWCWVYPYAEAPLLATIDAYEQETEFVWEHPEPPYTVDDQLRFILPEASLRAVGLEPRFPDELYDEATETRHPWMRRFAWEADPWVSVPLTPLTKTSEYVLPPS
jgi:5'-3' exonuclease